MSDAVTTEKYKGYTIGLHYDEDCQNPRHDEVQLGVLMLNRKLDLNWSEGDEFQAKLDEIRGRATSAGQAIEWFRRWMLSYGGATQVIGVGMIDHSGQTYYPFETGVGINRFDPGGWDSGWVGFIFDTAATREQCGTPPELIRECLIGELQTYNQWQSGDCYGYVITDPQGEQLDDSCWGFYGDEYVMTEAKSVIDWEIEHRHGQQIALFKNLVSK